MSTNHSDLIDRLTHDLQPVRRLRRRDGVIACGAAALAAVATVLTGFGLRADVLAGHPDPVFLLTSGLFLLLAAAASWRVLEMGQPFVGNHRDGWVWAAAMAALLPASALLTMAIGWAGGIAPTLDSDGVTCEMIDDRIGFFAAALNCPHDDIAHIGLWHGATVVVSALLGRLLLPRLIRW